MGGSVDWNVKPYTKNAVGLIPNQGTYPGCKFDPQVGYI